MLVKKKPWPKYLICLANYLQDDLFFFVFSMKSRLPDKFNRKEKINRRGIDALTQFTNLCLNLLHCYHCFYQRAEESSKQLVSDLYHHLIEKTKMNGRGLDIQTQIMHECIFESFVLLPLALPKRKSWSNQYLILYVFVSVAFCTFFPMDGSGAFTKVPHQPTKIYILVI